MYGASCIIFYCYQQMHIDVSCLVLHILLNQMAAFVFSNFSLVFLYLQKITALCASIILMHVRCILYYFVL